jgi:hypothetical protein
MAKTKVNIIQLDTEPAKSSIKDLRKALMEYKNQMSNLEEGSDAFLEVAKKAGEVKHQIDEINESIKGASSDFGDMLGNVTNVAAGMTGAFQAVAGGLQAIGVESKAVDEAIARMQGLMAITQGLASIDTAIKSMDKLQKSITSTTAAAQLLKTVLQPKVFLALSAAIGALTILFSKHKKAQEEAIAVQEKYNKKLKEEEKIRKETKIQKYLDNLNTELRIKKEIAGIKFGNNDLEEQRELLKEYKQTRAELMTEAKFYRDGNSMVGEDRDAELQKRNKAIAELNNLIAEIETEIRVLEAVAAARAKLEKGKWDKLASQNKMTEITPTISEKAVEDAINQFFKNKGVKTKITPIISPDEMAEAVADATNKGLERLAEEDYNSIEERIRRLGDRMFETLSETTQLFSESSLGITGGWISSLDEFQQVFNMTMDLVKNEGKNTWGHYTQLAAASFGAIGGMLNTLSNEQDASSEEGFKQMKNLQIAATVMNMLSGIMSAWTSAMQPSNAWMTPAGQIAMGTAMSGLIAGIGAAQIAKIQSQTMQSANPNFNPNAKSVSNIITPPVQHSQAVQGASTEGAIRNQKVYVTETDITETITKVNVQESENVY